ncbi:hypothetical protein [Streptomyces sp. ST1015]|uniref:hypothetical protein n=1 Tax=Streptomyces sp. ST1015 TaxID=1848900 RepID=UPI000DD9A16F|nr:MULTISPECIES: hypothetical protein [unclassified Streptomyces]QZZ29289.1 hypothetical protein A7X85_26265 [Streptomyces sp. ST1015]
MFLRQELLDHGEVGVEERSSFWAATLEKAASGMSRSHIRHYVDNRADLVGLFRARRPQGIWG